LKPSPRPAGRALSAVFLLFVGLLCLMLAPLARVLELDLTTGLSPVRLGLLLAGAGLLSWLAAWRLWRPPSP